MQPYFSIVMPVYNNEKLLPNAVNSIINQTFSDWELIIVDDGSTDNTPLVADSFAESDNRIRVIHQENQWIFKSYNNGYAAAKGKYIFIVNSDDTINPESFQRIYDVAEIHNADMIMFNMNTYDCNKNQNILKDTTNRNYDIKEDFSYNDISDIHKNWPEFLLKNWVNHQCVYKSEIAKKLLYRTDYYSGDVFYNLDIADSLKTVAGTSCFVYNWFMYVNENLNASSGKYYDYEHNMFNEYYFGYIELFKKWETFDKDHKDALMTMRMRKLTIELQAYTSEKCPLTTDEKLRKIMTDLSDGVVYNAAKELDRLEEYESRVLSGLRELFIREIPDENSEYYFFYEMLDRLLAYEKDEEDMKLIEKAIYHPLNPDNIGETFFKKLTEERVDRNV